MHIARSAVVSAIVVALAAAPAAANSGGASMGGGFRGGGWGGGRGGGGLGAMGIGIGVGAMLGGIASQPAAPAGPGYYPPMQQYQPPQYDPSQAYQPSAYQPQYYPPTQQYQPPPQQYADPGPQYAPPPDDAPPPPRRAAPPPRSPAATADPAPQVMPASAGSTLDTTVNAEPPPAALQGPLLQEINGQLQNDRSGMDPNAPSQTLIQINDGLKSTQLGNEPVVPEPTPDTTPPTDTRTVAQIYAEQQQKRINAAAAGGVQGVNHAVDVLNKWSLPPPPKNKLEKRMREIDGVVNDFILK